MCNIKLRVAGSLVSLALVILSISVVKAGSFSKDNSGTTGAQFLKIGCGAKAIGMGEAYAAVSDDASAIYWNPAGLSQIRVPEVSAMHAVWLEEISYDFLSYAQPMLGGGLGISLNYLSMSKIERLDINGDTAGSFKPYDGAVNIAYGRNIIGSLKGGINLKYIKQTLDGENAAGYAVDAGVMLPINNNKANIALAAQNIGPKMKFLEEEYDLPLAVRLGVSYNVSSSLLIAVDGVLPSDNDPNAHIGCEYKLNSNNSVPIALRAGYKTTTVEDLSSLSGLSAGIGFGLGMLKVDYAWVPYGDLGDTHRLSLGLKFGEPKAEKVSAKPTVKKVITTKSAPPVVSDSAVKSDAPAKKTTIRKRTIRTR